MKRFLLISISMLLAYSSFFACSPKEDVALQNTLVESTELPTPVPTPKPTQAPTPEPTPEPVSWEVSEIRDAFGDVTSRMVYGIFRGSYTDSTMGGQSNPATLLIDYTSLGSSKGFFTFSIQEDGADWQKFYSFNELTCAFKIDDKKYYGSLVTSGSTVLVLIEDWQGREITGNAGLPQKLIEAIKDNKKVPFIVNSGTSQYTFQIDGNGYQEAMKALRGN